MDTTEEMIVKSPEDTDRLAWHFAAHLKKGDVLGLTGPLGAGKTRFTQALFKALGARDYVRSPSFTLINEYEGRMPLYHMDLYRLKSPSDLDDLGYEEYFYGSGIVVVEWADKALAFLPPHSIVIDFALVPGHPDWRRVTVRSLEPGADRVVAEVKEAWRSLP